MTRIYNAERGFKDELLEGLTSAYGRYLRRVPGASAVMSVHAPIPGQVSVIIGGGSGHYPAFAGLMGPGLGANIVAPGLARTLIRRWLEYRFDPGSASAAKVAIIRAFESDTREG